MAADWPATKKAGDLTISVDQHGYPFWTRIEGRNGHAATLSHDEARDLLYIMQRIHRQPTGVAP